MKTCIEAWMESSKTPDLERRVLFVPPTARDAQLTCAMLERARIPCVPFKDAAALCAAIAQGAGILLLTEEFLVTPGMEKAIAALDDQPPWSDLPAVILMRGGAQSPVALRALGLLRNVTLLERPAPQRSVLSAIQAAIRGRERQYVMRDQIEALRTSEGDRKHLLESEQAARREAERTNRMKDEFLATLGHELRSPLNAIMGWVELLKRTRATPELVAEGIDAIDRNVRAQRQLIEDLLDVSRITSGKVRLDVRRFAIDEVLEAAVESTKPAAVAKGIRLLKDLDTEGVLVSGDAGRLQQVLWNLLTNAVKFTPRGGLIHVESRVVESHLEISVRDTGQGISPAFLPRMFQRFSQADATTTRRHGGLGLGLSIVKNLVEMHGGTIRAESAGEGRGATFIITLPVQAVSGYGGPGGAGRVVAEKPGHLVLPHLRGIRVLIVDDEPDAREVIRRLLLECEAVPTVAASAFDAQKILDTFVPDLILSDVGMPDRDGYAFIREVRQRGITTPALAVTAFARPEDRERCIQAGFQMHLPKPVEPMELLRAMAQLAHVEST